MHGTMSMSESIRIKIANIFLIFTWVVSQDWGIEIVRTKSVLTPIFELHDVFSIFHSWGNMPSICFDLIQFVFRLFKFFPPQSRRTFLYDSQTHTTRMIKKFIPKLRSLLKTNVCNLDFKTVEFVSVTNKSIQINKNLPLKVGSIILFFKKVKTKKSTKMTF